MTLHSLFVSRTTFGNRNAERIEFHLFIFHQIKDDAVFLFPGRRQTSHFRKLCKVWRRCERKVRKLVPRKSFFRFTCLARLSSTVLTVELCLFVLRLRPSKWKQVFPRTSEAYHGVAILHTYVVITPFGRGVRGYKGAICMHGSESKLSDEGRRL